MENILKNRRSIRKFQPRQVTDQDLERRPSDSSSVESADRNPKGGSLTWKTF